MSLNVLKWTSYTIIPLTLILTYYDDIRNDYKLMLKILNITNMIINLNLTVKFKKYLFNTILLKESYLTVTLFECNLTFSHIYIYINIIIFMPNWVYSYFNKKKYGESYLD